MSKVYIEPGRAALTGATVSRKGAVSYGEFASDRLPDANDDLTQGFAEGSVWHHADRRRMYICVDSTAGAAVWRDLGEAYKITVTCRNNTGSTISKGRMVYVTGALGDHPTIALADKDSETTSSRTLGMVVNNIANNADGQVALSGTVDKLNTNAYVAGTPLWLGDDGQWTATKPTPPAHSVFVGWVSRSNANNGRVILHVQNGYELDELHDVLISTPTNGQVLAYDSATSLWKNATPASGGIELIHSQYADVSATNTTADSISFSVPAGKLSSNGDALRLKATFVASGSIGQSTLEPSFGGTSLGTYSFTPNGTYHIEVLLTRTTNAIYRTILNTGLVASNVYTETDTASAVYFDSARTFKVAISTNNASRTITFHFGTIEFLPSP